ncbi:MAG TPA: thioredoxin domain-containing protein [Candidatus Binatia bacterium]|nr:thioredoxin domain-containing protein [Candidatus Binatia bacterium]
MSQRIQRESSVRNDERRRLGIVVLLLSLLVSQRAAAQQSIPAATVDDKVIMLDEVDRTIGASLAALEEQIFQLRRQRLESLIAEQLLTQEASRKGISVADLLDREVGSQAASISDAEIERFYDANKARLPALEASLRERIRAYLNEQAAQARREALVARLRQQSNIAIHLKAPPVHRVTLKLDGAPARGADNAPVTIVKFEDFHCPFCKEAQNTLAALATRYGERVRIVHKDYPIDSLHPQARLAHVAARCAQEQGKFWAYHDALYAAAPKASPEDLKSFAQASGVELQPFEACLSSGKYAAAIESDINEGTRVGVTGTPAFFINGRMLGGAQPLEQFVRIIEEELEQRR